MILKTTENYFSVLYTLALTLESVHEILKCDHSIKYEMKATEQYFPLVLFIMLYKVFLTFESVGEILKCDH